MGKRNKSQEGLGKIIFWSMLILVTLVFLVGLFSSLVNSRIISKDFFYYLALITLPLILLSLFVNKYSKFKVNTYVKIAVILSVIVLSIGFHLFQTLYSPTTDISEGAVLGEVEEMLWQLIGNGSSEIFYPLICTSKEGNSYFVKNDKLVCHFEINLSGSDYTLSHVNVFGYNETPGNFMVTDTSCKNGRCDFNIRLSGGFDLYSIRPTFYNQSNFANKISPIRYYIKVNSLMDYETYREINHDKITLLLVIITASFISIWSGLYHIKKLIEQPSATQST